MHCPFCVNKSLSSLKILFFLKDKCKSCQRLFGVKNPIGFKNFLLYGIVLAAASHMMVDPDWIRISLFSIAGTVATLGHIRFGHLVLIRDDVALPPS